MIDGYQRLAETERAGVRIDVDGAPVAALAGDTVLVALLAAGLDLGPENLGEAPRAGFCLMGTCRGCWIRTADGGWLKACTSYVEEGLALLTRPPERR